MNAPTEYSVPSISATRDAVAPDSTTPVTVTRVTRFANHVRQHPTGTLLVAAGLGLAAVLAVRAFFPPPPPQNRAARTLEEILHRLKGIAQPAYDRAVGFAEDGAHAVDKGFHGLADLHLDRKLSKAWRGFTGLFH
jgi:hypothetical protein